MGLDNPLHIAFLLILLLLVFGAKRLPEMGRSLGSGMRGFKDSLGGEHEHSSLVASAEQHASPAATTAAPAAAPVAPVVVPVREPVIAVVREPGTPVA
jgi:sec-independent protein translocase protein TatA